MEGPADDHRLPGHVRPRHYRLTLAVDPDAEGFRGSVVIALDVGEPTTWITLHSVDLSIHRASLRHGDGRQLEASVEPDTEHEWVTLRFPEQVPPGSTELHLDYDGRLCERLVGLYRSSFELEGEPQNLAVTQFESTHARRALPCFDEPGFKASFGLTVEVPEHLTAVSNAAEQRREPTGERTTRITFADTVRMSTYLLALVVGPLEVTEAPMVSGRGGDIPLRIVHPPGQGHLCEFALDVATAALLFFEDYYDLPCPGDKVDLVAVPDFAFGAMENLGCITFREVLLLVDPATATPRELERVADVINHELAHMWFGDLVTMAWWNGIWLNEAFATFMETIATDSFRPEWDVWTTFGSARSAAFDTDALHSTRPIEYEVRTAADAEAMFDILTYEKGCSVVRMLEQYLGPEIFREGIRAYLRRHAWGNTETTDLWDVLEDVTGEPVRRIADAWIFRGGHPIVAVERTPTGIRLHQRRALYDPASTDGAPLEGFPVPMTLELVDDSGAIRRERLLLDEPTSIDPGTTPTLVRTNPRGNGFFRTLLDTDLRRALAASTPDAAERFVLLDDTWFAALVGDIEPSEALDTVEDLIGAGEDDPSVWRHIRAVGTELQRLVHPDRRPELAAWVRAVLEEPRRRHPADRSTSGRGAEVAATLLAFAGTVGEDAGARDLARGVFDAASHEPPVDPAISAAALEVVASTAGQAEHEEIRRRWQDARTPQDEQRHLSALVLTHRAMPFDAALELCRSDVRSQDAPYVLRRALMNLERGPDGWRFVAEHFDELVTRLPSGALPRMLEGIRGFADPHLAEQVASFLGDHTLPTGELQVTQHLERMWATVATAQRLRSIVAVR